MKIVVVDPGLSGPAGHNGSTFEELARELPSRGLRPVFLVSRGCPPGALAAPGVEVRRLFSLDGYTNLERAFTDESQFDALLAGVEGELRTVDWDGVQAVLMPTAYPLHLIALARVLPDVLPPGARAAVSIGLLMPVSFWVSQPTLAVPLGEMMLTAVCVLKHHFDAFVYSETGRYEFGETTMELPRMLPAISGETETTIRSLVGSGRDGTSDGGLRFGFFGSPFASKGIEVLHRAAALVTASGSWCNRLELVLPAGQQRLAGRFTSLGARVSASSRSRDNAEYLAAMSEVDVVLLPYDPAHYGSKLSGVLFEALALGKPVVVTDGCEPLIAFLDQSAPGSYVLCGFDAESLAEVLAMPADRFDSIAQAARASAPVVLAMKSMSRHLAAAGIRLPRVAAAQPRSVATETPSKGGAAVTPVVSIVIPVFQRESLIEATIESALAQTFTRIEVVVVDNASSDATVAVAHRIAARDPRVVVHRNATNVGPVRNWIEGVRLARAPFVKLLFSDDLIGPRFVEKMLPPLLDPEVAFSICPAVVGDAPWQGRLFYAPFDRATRIAQDVFESLSLASFGRLPLSPCAGMFRRDDLLQSLRTHLDGVNEYDFSATGAGVDWLTYMLTARRYAQVAFDPEPLVYFRSHPGSITIADEGGAVWRGYQLAVNWYRKAATA